MNEGAPIIHLDHSRVIQAFRDITNATNERTLIADNLPFGPVGNNAPIVSYREYRAIAYALVLANLNSIPLDWASRNAVGGVHMSFFIIKQLPVLPPDAYLEETGCGGRYVEFIVPRVLELIYTGHELEGFAADLGYRGQPFLWDEPHRHRLQCELDALFSRMYRLERADLAWILDSRSPGTSFPSLKQHELKRFGEYRTQHYVLEAFDQLSRGENINSHGV